MRRNSAKIVLAAMFTVPLGACNALHGLHLFSHNVHRAKSVQPAQAANADYAPPVYAPSIAPETQSGRALLANGLPGSAIDSFVRALSSGEPVAPAVNGLGIAYARLGRLDLARRYFERAIAEDPGNDHYQDNLTLLLAVPQYAMDQQDNCATQRGRSCPPDNQSSTLAQAAAKPAIAAAAIPGRMQRISRNEVFIVTAPALPAPIMASVGVPGSRASAGRRMAVNAYELRRFVPIVRIALAPTGPATAHLAATAAPTSATPATVPSARRIIFFPAMTGNRSTSLAVAGR